MKFYWCPDGTTVVELTVENHTYHVCSALMSERPDIETPMDTQQLWFTIIMYIILLIVATEMAYRSGIQF